MGYIKEPGNVGLAVGPSDFTESTKQTIVTAIELYKKTGRKPVSCKTVISKDTIATLRANHFRKVGTDKQL